MKNKIKIIINIILVFSILIGIATVSIGEVYKNVEGYKEKLIRLHVIANSDTKEDQDIKLEIRDKIIEEMTPKFEKSESIEETEMILKTNMKLINEIANRELHKIGKDYGAKVFFGDYDFPTKSYGKFTLPAGNYRALKIILGEGVGENWWCVMFPPLCFLDLDNNVESSHTEENMQKALTDDEYEMISSEDNKYNEETMINEENARPVKIKFKVVEVIERNKMKFANMFDSGI
ncbi:MAG: stage II sporulation protein R [Senegalia sp. (in: firmicutes)]|uniref:stage II sporulation protein R n=1 Tax=Senegalia sp. (in: firmicutes) TaxID=1924098 RepID=UPI003F9DCFD8